jgi:signal transduction histidine kinase
VVHQAVQEALTNTIKHADASAAGVRLVHGPGSLHIEVSDDGRTAAPAGAPHEGHGLAGMRERVAMYGGELTAGRTADGYLVTATLWTGA